MTERTTNINEPPTTLITGDVTNSTTDGISHAAVTAQTVTVEHMHVYVHATQEQGGNVNRDEDHCVAQGQHDEIQETSDEIPTAGNERAYTQEQNQDNILTRQPLEDTLLPSCGQVMPSASVGRIRNTSIAACRLEQVFPMKDKVTQCMENGKFYDAITLLNMREDFHPDLHKAEHLSKLYVCLLRTKKTGKAAQVRGRLISIIQTRTQCKAEDTKAFANKLLKKQKYFEAILFYQISAGLYKNKQIPNDTATGIATCTAGIRQTIQAVLRLQDTNWKSFLQCHIIPLMFEMRDDIRKLPGVEGKIKCVSEAWCLHRIEYSLKLVQDANARKEVLNAGIHLMEEGCGMDACKFQIYGHFLHNLGVECSGEEAQALGLFEQALKVYTTVTDWATECQMRDSIAGCQNKVTKFSNTQGK